MAKKKVEIDQLKKAMMDAGLTDMVMESFISRMFFTCDEACRAGCAACCETGSANRFVGIQDVGTQQR